MPNDPHQIEGVNFPLPPAVPLEARTTLLEERQSDLLHLLTATSAQVAKLEERLKTLETFHHWATTQAFPILHSRIAKLEQKSPH